MRGQQSLFSDVFVVEKKAQTTRPRNFYLPERNEALIHRYYYHAEINRLRYDDCLNALENEFYITQARIIVVLNKEVHRISDLVREAPTIRELQEKFPHFNWKKINR